MALREVHGEPIEARVEVFDDLPSVIAGAPAVVTRDGTPINDTVTLAIRLTEGVLMLRVGKTVQQGSSVVPIHVRAKFHPIAFVDEVGAN